MSSVDESDSISQCRSPTTVRQWLKAGWQLIGWILGSTESGLSGKLGGVPIAAELYSVRSRIGMGAINVTPIAGVQCPRDVHDSRVEQAVLEKISHH